MKRREAAAVLIALLFLCRSGRMEEDTKSLLKTIITGQEKIFQMIDDMSMMKWVLTGQEKIIDKMTDLQNRVSKIEGSQKSPTNAQQCSTAHQLSQFYQRLSRDECRDGGHNCSKLARCEDKLIGYRCVCFEGYAGNGNQCQDVNECRIGTHKCHSLASCTNTVGSYICKCPPWYVGDGFNCEAPGCNPPAQVIYGLGCVMPDTKKKTWELARQSCRDKGARLIEGITPEMLIPLKKTFHEVLEGWLVWVGVKNARWLTGKIPVTPRSLWREDEPDGDNQQCGWITLWPMTPYFGDAYCSNVSPSLCQRIY
ncbi:uncharacterized protein [Palaemon carinicauda]|uniref:uncharacterized protein isoform X1 n=1 Tax=Palaemon carinicauda TaxID=392227 RepID=UPI0035B645E9